MNQSLVKNTPDDILNLSYRVWKFESKGYHVVYNGNYFLCQCKGFVIRLNDCKHIRMLRKYIGKNQNE